MCFALAMWLSLPCLKPCEVNVYCEGGGGHRYQSGDGFSEMLLFEGLKTLRLHLLKAPQRLYFAKGFSKLKQLTNVELLRDYHDIYRPPDRSFSASSQFLHLPC